MIENIKAACTATHSEYINLMLCYISSRAIVFPSFVTFLLRGFRLLHCFMHDLRSDSAVLRIVLLLEVSYRSNLFFCLLIFYWLTVICDK